MRACQVSRVLSGPCWIRNLTWTWAVQRILQRLLQRIWITRVSAPSQVFLQYWSWLLLWKASYYNILLFSFLWNVQPTPLKRKYPEMKYLNGFSHFVIWFRCLFLDVLSTFILIWYLFWNSERISQNVVLDKWMNNSANRIFAIMYSIKRTQQRLESNTLQQEKAV